MSAGRRDWPAKCTLMGCTQPHRRPHHHHMLHGHLMVGICVCSARDQPGTSPKEGDRG